MGQGSGSTRSFQVYDSGRNKRTSLIATILVAAVVLGGGGLGGYLWLGGPRVVEHVRQRDGLAAPAALVMGYQGPPKEAERPLADLLTAGSPSQRRAAAYALGAVSGQDWIPHLAEAAERDAESAVRGTAVRALRRNGHTSVAPLILKVTRDRDPLVAAAACECLGELEATQYVPELIDLLDHNDARVQTAALHALEAFTPGDETYGLNRQAWREWYQRP